MTVIKGWPEVSEHVRAVVRGMSMDERELVTFRIVHAKVMETRIVSEEDVLKYKKAIKELVVEEIAALRGEAEDDGSDTERLGSKTPATRKLSNNRVRRREASGSELDDADTERKEKREKKEKRQEKERKTKEAPHAWNEDTERLRALVVTVAQGLPKHVSFKLPTTCYRGKPSDREMQERIAAFLTSKGLKSLQPNDEEMAAFRTKVFATPSSAMSNVVTDFELNGIESSNIVESTGVRPRRAAAAAFIAAQQGKNTRKEQADSDDEESLITAPLAPKTVPGRYILAHDDSD